jgi:hypothetical protein
VIAKRNDVVIFTVTLERENLSKGCAGSPSCGRRSGPEWDKRSVEQWPKELR